MGNSERKEYTPIDDYIDFDLAIHQATVALDEAGRIAFKYHDSDGLAKVGHYWVKLAEVIAVHAPPLPPEDKAEETPQTKKVGFVND